MNQLELTKIVAQASSLSERLSHGLLSMNSDQNDQQQIASRLSHWCQVVGGDWENLQKRLQWDGLDLDTVRSVLGAMPPANSQTYLIGQRP
jgi:hypothetical protein